MSLDVIYLTHNRREFTALTFELLVENTNWSLVDNLYVYDDQSRDGAREEVAERIHHVPVNWEIRDHAFGSPVAVMNDYVARSDSERFAKVDNDLALPPGWLDVFVGVMDDDDTIELLGSESPFVGPPPLGWDGKYTCTTWRHIGGNGLMKTDFFRRTGPMDVHGYHGFTGHQWKWEPRRGWVTPDIMLCLLDRCPIEPWLSLSKHYVKQGWQRPWKTIEPHWSMYWEWFTEKEAA